MEAVLDRRVKINPIVRPANPQKEVLTYETIQRLKREQQRLIDAGIIEKPQIVEGFSPKQWLDFQTAISIEDYFSAM